MALELAAGGAMLAATVAMIVWAENNSANKDSTAQHADLNRLASVLIGPAWEAWAPPPQGDPTKRATSAVPKETPVKLFNAPDSPARLPVKAHLLFEEGDTPPCAVELLQQQVDEMAALVHEHSQMRTQLERQLEAEMTLRREAEEKESLARAELMRHKREADRELEKERQTVLDLQAQMQALVASDTSESPVVPIVLRQKQGELENEKRKTARAEADARRLRAEMESAADQHGKELAVLNARLEEAQRTAQRAANENLLLRRKLREQMGSAMAAYPVPPSSPPHSSSSSPVPQSPASTVPPAVSPAVLWGGQN